ncbi:hypothetical protein [Sphaerimonospora thailandensis]|uniref:hypothetical protein n=1 Tax=Sphaerimonospora thailandensis TaxID=795644 RepID=UPI001951A2EF|nr:hypothetical protein [Sphaerimonospora thailandensis]
MRRSSTRTLLPITPIRQRSRVTRRRVDSADNRVESSLVVGEAAVLGLLGRVAQGRTEILVAQVGDGEQARIRM